MKTPFKIFINVFAILLFFSLTANNDNKNYKYVKEKKISKQFNVSSEATLKIDNSYGNIDIVSWNQNKVTIDVVIITRGNNEETTQDKLENISVDFTNSSTLVSAQTLFKDKKSSNWSWWGKKEGNVQMEINYTIKMPLTNAVDLNNDYGTISINELQGNAKISCDYGQLNIGALKGDNNSLSFDYTKNSTINYLNNGVIKADYSNFTLDKAEKLTLSADYTHTEIKQITILTYSNDYGKLNIGEVNSLTGNGSYMPITINTLLNDLTLNSSYGSITVNTLKNSVKRVSIKSKYAGIKMAYDSNLNFNFDINLGYAGLSGEEDLVISTQSKNYTSKSYSGYYGNKNNNTAISIKSDYGGVTLRKI